jgi:hypothetical protein
MCFVINCVCDRTGAAATEIEQSGSTYELGNSGERDQ